MKDSYMFLVSMPLQDSYFFGLPFEDVSGSDIPQVGDICTLHDLHKGSTPRSSEVAKARFSEVVVGDSFYRCKVEVLK